MGLHVPLHVFRSAAADVRTHESARPDHQRVFRARPPGEARAVSLAFLRYLELHGRSITAPEDGCGMRRMQRAGGETLVLDFWSRRAAEDFDAFWRRYSLSYGRIDRAEAPSHQACAA